jgi:pre-mRNA-splicing helicase BRR2
MTREDRQLVEDLFDNERIKILISTATLAWGVNLPAKTVIIKGTQIYSPEQGKWVELSPQDILQMLGRAGRPYKNTRGEGIILTSYTELKYYLSLVTNQLPIESQFITQLADQLNAEIVAGSVNNIKEGVAWLSYTYLYIRMMRAPAFYSIDADEIDDDPLLVKRRANLIHSAAIVLDKNNLINYDKKTGIFHVTTLGKIASHYYIKYPSIAIYNEHIKPNMGMIELFRVFSLSYEFKFIPTREEEKYELEKLLIKVPIPVKGSPDDQATKINVLLQAYISRMKLQGYALKQDMAYIHQSASRIIRGLFEVFMKRGWANVSECALKMCKMIDKRMWSCMTPLRQFGTINEKILRRIENQEHLTWEHLYNMRVQQISSIIKVESRAKTVFKFIHQFPRFELNAFVQPITRSCIQVELSVKPTFEWDNRVHGGAEPFWILVCDVDNEMLLYSEYFVLRKSDMSMEEIFFEFTVPLLEPINPQYFIKVISDRWLASETQIPISFKNLILPSKFPACTNLHDMQLIPVNHWSDGRIKKFLKKNGIERLNSIQTQVYTDMFETNSSCFLGAPGNSGKTVAS